jgi:uncharacterized integral membrane protein
MKLSTLLVFGPLAIIAAILAVANREPVIFRLVPFETDPAFTLVIPLFLLVFLSFLLGVVVGGATVAWRRIRNHRRKKLAAQDVAGALTLDAAKPSAEQPKP